MLPFLLPPGRQAFRALSRPARATVKQCYSVQAATRVSSAGNTAAGVPGSEPNPSVLATASTSTSIHPSPASVKAVESSSPTQPSKRKPKRTPSKRKPKVKAPVEIPEPSLPRTEIFLDKLLSEGLEPTPEDLERFRPDHYPDPVTQFARYKTTFAEVANDLDRSFTRDQIVVLITSSLDFTPTKTSRKNQLIDLILTKHWNLPSPSQLERERKEKTEVRKQVFPVSKAQLFILLGQDGLAFKELANRHRATLYVESSPKLAVRAEATKPDLKELGEEINILTKELTTSDIHLHKALKLGDSIVQSMSRQAGVYMEQIDASTLRLTAQNSEQLQYAQRLVWKAYMKRANQNLVISHTSSRGYDDSSAVYSMYPYASATPLPWFTGATAGFRPKKVGEWLMGSNMGPISSLNGAGKFEAALEAAPFDLKEVIKSVQTVGALSGSPLSITASSGHVVFTDPKPSRLSLLAATAQKEAVWPMKTPLEWVNSNHRRATYLSSLPYPLVGTEPVAPTQLIRLTYRLPDGKKSKLAEGSTPAMSRTLVYELTIQHPDPSQIGKWGAPLKKDNVLTAEHVGFIDLVLPDRPMDLQLRISTQGAHEFWQTDSTLEHLVDYTEELRPFTHPESQSSLADLTIPSPPSQIDLDSKNTLVLESAYHVTQSSHLLQSPLNNPASADSWPDLSDMLLEQRMKIRPPVLSETQQPSSLALNHTNDSVNVILETKRDLESQDVVETCSIQCHDINNQEAWTEFLRSCDLMTTHMYPGVPAGSKAPSLASLSF